MTKNNWWNRNKHKKGQINHKIMHIIILLMCVCFHWRSKGWLTTYKSLHIVAHSRSVVVTSWTKGSSVGMTVSFCLQWQRMILFYLFFFFTVISSRLPFPLHIKARIILPYTQRELQIAWTSRYSCYITPFCSEFSWKFSLSVSCIVAAVTGG